MGDDLAQRVAVIGGQRATVGGRQPGDFLGDAAGGCKEEVARTAGRVADAEFEQRLYRLPRVGGQRLRDHRVERALDQFLHQAVGRVIRAAELARIALGAAPGLCRCVADEAEAANAGAQGQFGHQFEQAFVDAAEFLGIHVAVIDARQRGAVAEEAEAEERAEQRLVVELGGVEVRALRGVEEATERRQAKRRLAATEAGEGDGQRLPEVGMAIVAAPPGGQPAQAGEAVAGEVARPGLAAGLGCEDEFAILHGGEEDEAVDEAQQLLEVGLGAQLAAFDAAAQLAVGRVGEKAGSKHTQGSGDAFAQPVADADADFLGGLAPVFERAVSRLGAGLTETRGVGEQPESGEIAVEAFAEDGFEIGLDVGGPGQTGVVAQDAQLEAVADDGPERGVAGIENLLGEQEGRTAARAVAVPAARLVERLAVTGEDKRHAAVDRGMADGEAALADDHRAAPPDVREAKHAAAEGFEEVVGAHPLQASRSARSRRAAKSCQRFCAIFQ